MAKSSDTLPVGPLPDLMKWWRKCKVQGAIIGGLAVALRGFARTTLDVDAVVFIEEAGWPSFLTIGSTYSIESRIPEPLAFAKEASIFLLSHAPSGVDLDITLGQLAYEKLIIRRAVPKKIGKATVPIATVEDLIVLKAVANRPRDLADIQGLLEVNTSIDLAYIREQIEELAAMADLPDAAREFERILTNHLRSVKTKSAKKGKLR